MTEYFEKFLKGSQDNSFSDTCSRYLGRLEFAWESIQQSWGKDHPALKKVKEFYDKEVAACEAVKKKWEECQRCMHCNSNNLQPSFAGDPGVTCCDCHRDDV